MGHSLFNLPSDFACFGQQGQKMRYPRRGPSGAVGARTAAQKGYALHQIAVLNLYPAAVDRSDRIPGGKPCSVPIVTSSSAHSPRTASSPVSESSTAPYPRIRAKDGG